MIRSGRDGQHHLETCNPTIVPIPMASPDVVGARFLSRSHDEPIKGAAGNVGGYWGTLVLAEAKATQGR